MFEINIDIKPFNVISKSCIDRDNIKFVKLNINITKFF